MFRLLQINGHDVNKGIAEIDFHWAESKKNKKFWEELIACFPWYDTDPIENDASNNSYIIACVFVTMVTFLPSHCLATVGRFLPKRKVC
jgi:hypothetical protein